MESFKFQIWIFGTKNNELKIKAAVYSKQNI